MTFTTRDNKRSTVLSGYGINVAVRSGHLVLEDGVGSTRRLSRLSRLDGVRRIIVLGDSGSISLDALRWLYDTGTAFVHIGRDAHIVTVGSPRGINDVRLRRGQALAAFTDTGLTITRELLTPKLEGQLALLRRIENSAQAHEEIEYALNALNKADTMTALRYAESRAAVAYWTAWRDVEVRFVSKDRERVPKHWRTVGARQSLLTDASRKAVTPVNALLNYLYAVLESEAHLAAVAVGCDPEIGILHSDRAGRNSFACDLMEPVRPHVDAFVLHLLESRSFLKSDFFETREGVCRVMPPLTEALAVTGAEWAKWLAPIAEHVAGALANSPDPISSVPISGGRADPRATTRPYRTPLTQRNRSRKRSDQSWGDRGVPQGLTGALPTRCKECGTEVPKRRSLCDTCLKTLPARAARRAVEAQAQMKAVGADKRSGETARAKHRAYASRQAVELAAWKAANPVTPNPQTFTKEIWPKLRHVSIATLVAATGLSDSMCKTVRNGGKVPHPRHWDKFRSVASRKK